MEPTRGEARLLQRAPPRATAQIAQMRTSASHQVLRRHQRATKLGRGEPTALASAEPTDHPFATKRGHA